MPSNTRHALGLGTAISLFTALFMRVQIVFKAIGWVRIRSTRYGPFI
jgi:hypothetical protein